MTFSPAVLIFVVVLVAYLWWTGRKGHDTLDFSPLTSTRDRTPGTLLNPSPGDEYKGIDFNAPVM